VTFVRQKLQKWDIVIPFQFRILSLEGLPPSRMTEMSPPLEVSRLQTLEMYELADMPPDHALDDLARVAAQMCNAPAAGICLIENDAVNLVGRFGIEVHSVPRNTMPCETTVAGEGVYQIPDARRDPEYSPGGIPVGDRRYRFYAGAPVYVADGTAIGALFVLDSAARKLTTNQLEVLETLSQAVTTRLELTVRVREADRGARAQRRVETALTVERNFVSAVLDTVGALVVVFDTAGRIVRFNRACEIISGYSSSELVGKYAWERLIPEADVAEYIDSFERIRSGDFPTTYENCWLASDATSRRISWSATALVDSQGQVAFIIATGIDVTVQRVAETQNLESESRYRQLIEGSLGMVATHDLEGRMLSINDYGARGIGTTVNAVVGNALTDFVRPARRGLIAPYMQALLTGGEAQGLLHLIHAVTGEERVFAYRNRLVEPVGKPRYVLAFGIDVTEQIRAEERLRVLIRQSNSVLESVGDGIIGIDLEGNITVVNPAAAQMLGHRSEEILGRNMHELLHHSYPDGTPYQQADCPIQSSLANLATVRVANEVFWRKDGSQFPVEYVARPQIEAVSSEEKNAADSSLSLPSSVETAKVIHHLSGSHQIAIPAADEHRSGTSIAAGPNDIARGRAVGVVVAFTDISERNALDRMKDEFISTVSHELRTPLTSLRAALGLVAGGALNSRPEKMRQMMDIAIGNTDRLVRLVNDILDLERIGSGKSELHSIMCSVDEMLTRASSLQHAAAVRQNVRFTIEGNGVQVWADPDRILQTLTNLIANAIKFSPAASTLPSEIRLTSNYVSEDEAIIEVTDNGRGIPADKLQQIFERFKQVDASDSRVMGGTGLGLAICRSIVSQHGGHIWATSKLGEGATFHFTLPTRPIAHLT
jgi:two-component system sensor histidine kinase VicK